MGWKNELYKQELLNDQMHDIETQFEKGKVQYGSDEAKDILRTYEQASLEYRASTMKSAYLMKEMSLTDRYLKKPIITALYDALYPTDKGDILSSMRIGTFVAGAKLPEIALPTAGAMLGAKTAPLVGTVSGEGALASIETMIDEGRAVDRGEEWTNYDRFQSFLWNMSFSTSVPLVVSSGVRGGRRLFKRGIKQSAEAYGKVKKTAVEKLLDEVDEAEKGIKTDANPSGKPRTGDINEINELLKSEGYKGRVEVIGENTVYIEEGEGKILDEFFGGIGDKEEHLVEHFVTNAKGESMDVVLRYVHKNKHSYIVDIVDKGKRTTKAFDTAEELKLHLIDKGVLGDVIEDADQLAKLKAVGEVGKLDDRLKKFIKDFKPDTPEELGKSTVKELRQKAKGMGVKNYGKMKKAELIQEIIYQSKEKNKLLGQSIYDEHYGKLAKQFLEDFGQELDEFLGSLKVEGSDAINLPNYIQDFLEMDKLIREYYDDVARQLKTEDAKTILREKIGQLRLSLAKRFKTKYGMFPDQYRQHLEETNQVPRGETVTRQAEEVLGEALGEEEAETYFRKLKRAKKKYTKGHKETNTILDRIRVHMNYTMGSTRWGRKVQGIADQGFPPTTLDEWRRLGYITSKEAKRLSKPMSTRQVEIALHRVAMIEELGKMVKRATRIAGELRDLPTEWDKLDRKHPAIKLITYLIRKKLRVAKRREHVAMIEAFKIATNGRISTPQEAFNLLEGEAREFTVKGVKKKLNQMLRFVEDPTLLPDVEGVGGDARKVAEILHDYKTDLLHVSGDITVEGDTLLKTFIDKHKVLQTFFHYTDETVENGKLDYEYAFDYEAFVESYKKYIAGLKKGETASIDKYVKKLVAEGEFADDDVLNAQDMLLTAINRAHSSYFRGLETSQLFFSKKDVLSKIEYLFKYKDTSKEGAPSIYYTTEEIAQRLATDSEYAERFEEFFTLIRMFAHDVLPENIGYHDSIPITLGTKTLAGADGIRLTGDTDIKVLRDHIRNAIKEQGQSVSETALNLHMSKVIRDYYFKNIGRAVLAETGAKDFDRAVYWYRSLMGMSDSEVDIVIGSSEAFMKEHGLGKTATGGTTNGVFYVNKKTKKPTIAVLDRGDVRTNLGTFRHELEHLMDVAYGRPELDPSEKVDVWAHSLMKDVEDGKTINEAIHYIYGGHFRAHPETAWEVDYLQKYFVKDTMANRTDIHATGKNVLKDLTESGVKRVDFDDLEQAIEYGQQLLDVINMSTRTQGRRKKLTDVADLFKGTEEFKDFMFHYGGDKKMFKTRIAEALSKHSYLNAVGLTKGQLINTTRPDYIPKFEAELGIPVNKVDSAWQSRDDNTKRVLGEIRSALRNDLSIDRAEVHTNPVTLLDQLYAFLGSLSSRALVAGRGMWEGYTSHTSIANFRYMEGDDFLAVMADLGRQFPKMNVNFAKISVEGLYDTVYGGIKELITGHSIENSQLTQTLRKILSLSDYEMSRYEIDKLVNDFYDWGEDLGWLQKRIKLLAKSSFRSLQKGDINEDMLALRYSLQRAKEIVEIVKRNKEALIRGDYSILVDVPTQSEKVGKDVTTLFTDGQNKMLATAGITSPEDLLRLVDEYDRGLRELNVDSALEDFHLGDVESKMFQDMVFAGTSMNPIEWGKHLQELDPTFKTFGWLFGTTRAIFHSTKTGIGTKYNRGVMTHSPDIDWFKRLGVVLMTATVPSMAGKIGEYMKNYIVEGETALESLEDDMLNETPDVVAMNIFENIMKNTELGVIFRRTSGNPIAYFKDEVFGSDNPAKGLGYFAIRGLIGGNMYGKYRQLVELYGYDKGEDMFLDWLGDGRGYRHMRQAVARDGGSLLEFSVRNERQAFSDARIGR